MWMRQQFKAVGTKQGSYLNYPPLHLRQLNYQFPFQLLSMTSTQLGLVANAERQLGFALDDLVFRGSRGILQPRNRMDISTLFNAPDEAHVMTGK